MQITGTIVDVVAGAIFSGSILIESGKIAEVRRHSATLPTSEQGPVILPGFVDSHVHVESSMLPPSEFARLAVVHGTVGTVSDPHEIANVLGVAGVDWMIADGKRVPFKFSFGAPSCVPATSFETAGAVVDARDIELLLKRPEIRYLSEMMNFPGVIHGDLEVHKKLAAASTAGKVIDGHSPGLRGEQAKLYASYGITTDHECFTAEEARDKIACGMKILIREGSAAKNFDALIELLGEFPASIMFCSDDKHPNDLLVGHIDELVRRAMKRGFPVIDVLRAATMNPVLHYGLPIGLLQPGDPADFIVVDSLESVRVIETYIEGEQVASAGKANFSYQTVQPVNHFVAKVIGETDIRCSAPQRNHPDSKMRVIEVLPGQLVSKEVLVKPRIESGAVVSDVGQDVLKLVVYNRYREAAPSVAFVRGLGLQRGAIASTVAHDCHNIVAVGASDSAIVAAINLLVESKGGISAVADGITDQLPLPIAGLMSELPGERVARDYERLDSLAKQWGSALPAPFMTLSFLALLVIPELKLSDLGLFDGRSFEFVDLFVAA